MSLTEWAARKRIQVLEAELADMTDERDAFKAEAIELRRQLADRRASSVVVRRKCETCGGEGVTEIWDAPTPGDGPRCPDCDSGWQLAEGVAPFGEGRDWYVIPAREIQGDSQ